MPPLKNTCLLSILVGSFEIDALILSNKKNLIAVSGAIFTQFAPFPFKNPL